jgi:hypothetical protein
VGAEFGAVRPYTDQPITLTSSTGTIPLRVTNDSGQPVRVMVELASPHVRFTGGASMLRELGIGDTVLNFGVELKTTGRFTVQVVIRSPSGRPISPVNNLVVRSTAFNRIALFITLGAAFVLLALWARRFLPRART